ncbi:MAG: ABC transporter permease [Chloroflexi bacterium]|nr:ABC transporter permease [Chloroflexota bacterium]
MTTNTQSGVRQVPDSRENLYRIGGILRRLFYSVIRAPLTTLGTLIFAMFLIFALFSGQIAPYEYDDDQISRRGDLQRLQEPECPLTFLFETDCKNPFGTDLAGSDVFSRIIHGSREVFRLAGFGTLVAVIVGSTVGMLIGYYGGLLDEVVGRLLDSLMSIPVLLLALVLIGALGENSNNILVVLIIVYSPIVARVVRSNVLEIRTHGFVEAAKLRGEWPGYILFREILPSVIPALVVEASLRFSYAIFLVASLGFLGLGADPPTPNWGLMVSEYRDDFGLAPWTLNYSAGTISLLVISVNLMSDGIKRIVQRSS